MTLPIFKNPSLLAQALTHRSAVNEGKGQSHNERMEFLGDAVLELLVSEFLYRLYPEATEGELTKERTALVRTETLAQLAEDLSLSKHITISRGEARNGGQFNQSLLADTMEAIIGALYLDQGAKAVQTFLHNTLLSGAQEKIKKAGELDAKSKLQEQIQAKGYPAPIYQIVDISGPDHDRVFTAQVFSAGKSLGKGIGKSKQEAEQQAARASFPVV